MERNLPDSPREAASTGGNVGTGLPQYLHLLGGLALAWVVALGIHEQNGILAPAFLTLNLYVVAYPLQHKLNSLGVPRLIGSIISGLIVLAILLIFFGALAWAVVLFIQEIPQYQGSFITLYQSFIERLHEQGVSETQLLEQLQRQLSPSNVVSVLQGVTSSLTGVMSMMLVTVTVIFVTVIDSITFERRATLLSRWRPTVAQGLENFTRGVRRYWLVSSFFGLIVAVLDVVALAYMGVPLAIVWGVLSFLTNYIPNVGFVLGLLPPAIMALIANDPMTALLVVVAYCVINFVVQSVIQPKFTGESVGVTASVSLLSLLFWSWALGPLGAILALPATLLAKSLTIDIDPHVRWLNVFVASDPDSGGPPPTPGRTENTDAGPERELEHGRDTHALANGSPAPAHPSAEGALDDGHAAEASPTSAAPSAAADTSLDAAARPTSRIERPHVIGDPRRSRGSVLAAPSDASAVENGPGRPHPER